MKPLFTFGLTFLILFNPMLADADLVFMKETKEGKSVMIQKEGTGLSVKLNQSEPGQWAIYPDISSDGKKVAYVEGTSPTSLHLVHQDLDSGVKKELHLAQPGMVLHPKFTRNGKLLFFSAPMKPGKNTIAFLDPMNAQSLDEATILDASEESYFPRPSSDGNFVVYQRNENGKKEIVLFDRIENKKTVLAEGMAPALSFDEQEIAFTAKKDGHWNVFVLNRMTGKVTQKTSDPADEMAPTFQRNGTLVFASNKTGHYQLYQLADQQWLPLLSTTTADEADYYSPQYSGDTSHHQSLNAPFKGNPRSSFGTVSHQGKIYMCGGHQGAEHTYPPESFSDQFWVYDPSTDQWTELAPRPVKAHGYQLAAYGKFIYAFGGFAYSPDHLPRWKSLDQIDRYDLETGQWKTIGKLNSPRSSNVAVTIQDRVYLAAGWNSTPKFNQDLDGTFLDTIEIFDLKTESLSQASYRLPQPLRRALTGVEYQGKLLLIGGLGQGASHFELISNVTAIDPLTGANSELTPLPFATFAPAAGILKDRLYVFGGMFKMGEMSYDYVSHIYSLDLSQGIWSHTGRYLQETKGFSQVFSMDKQTLGILGGHHYFEGYDQPVSTFEVFR